MSLAASPEPRSAAATDEGVELWFGRAKPVYFPGESIEGSYRLTGWRDAGLTAVELSVLWYTAGQGEEDFYVHHFERRREPALPAARDEAPHTFACVLPRSPLSYDGRLVRVCWGVRVRGFLRGGRQRVVEAPFALVSAEAPDE